MRQRLSAVLDYTWPVAGGLAVWLHACPLIGRLGGMLVAVLRGPEPLGEDPLDVTQPDAFGPPHVGDPAAVRVVAPSLKSAGIPAAI